MSAEDACVGFEALVLGSRCSFVLGMGVIKLCCSHFTPCRAGITRHGYPLMCTEGVHCVWDKGGQWGEKDETNLQHTT